MTVRILQGDCRSIIRDLADKSLHAAVFSPPYFRLRDYLIAGQIGLEATPEAYIEELVKLCRDIRRVLRDDGSMWINIGDCYAGSGRGGNPTRATSTLQGSLQSQEASMVCRDNWEIGSSARMAAVTQTGSRIPSAGMHEKAVAAGSSGRAWVPAPGGLKQKDLIGIPWMLAFALRADGWWLRNDNIWAKPNGMPESTRDRSTRAHEYVFHLTKSEIYYFGYDEVRLPPAPDSVTRLARAMRGKLGQENPALVVSGGGYSPSGQPPHAGARRRDKQRGHGRRHAGFNDRWDDMSGAQQRSAGSALRTVWWVAPGGYNDEFCLKCRAFYPSSVLGDLRTEKVERDGRKATLRYCNCGACDAWLSHFAVMPEEVAAACILAGVPRGGVVLDPFGGAGTTGLVADQLQRDAILIELNPDYAEMAAHRIAARHPMLTTVGVEKIPEAAE